MIGREKHQIGIADAFVRPSRSITVLDKINQIIDWEPLRRKMESLYSHTAGGRPAFPPVMLFKAVLLQKWYNLSDPAAEEAIEDRQSFRRFLALNLDEKGPDHSTLHRFRTRIESIMGELMQMVNNQLDARHLIVRQGTLVDATLVESAAHPPSPDKPSTHDSEATWTKKHGKSVFGYKAHIGADQKSELIRQADLTPAHVHDGKKFEEMVSGDEETAYADKGYSSVERSEFLISHGIKDGIMFQGSKWRPFTQAESERNHSLGRVRKAVEHIFGTLKRIYQFRRCRYTGLRRNRADLFALCICYNLRRAVKLEAI